MSLTFNLLDLFNNYINIFIENKLNAILNSLEQNNVVFLQSINLQDVFWTVFIYFFNIYFFLLILYFFILFFSVGAKLVKNSLASITLNNVLYFYFSDLEEELGSLDDGLFYFLVFGGVIVWFFYIFLINSKLFFGLSWVISLLLLVGITGLIVPFSLLKNFGLAYPMYIRGGGKTTSLLFETMLDFVSISVISMRFFIQNIRFVFIFSAFFELYEFIYEKIYLNYTDTMFSISGYKSNYWLNISLDFILTWFLYLYYLGHLVLLFLAQLSIYFILSFWLFFFLYSTFTLTPQEKYFLSTRKLCLTL